MEKALKYYLVLCSTCFFLNLRAGNPSDSLLKLIAIAKNDSIKVDALIELASLNKNARFLEYSNTALELAQKAGYKNGAAAAHMALSKHHYRKENYSVSLLHCITAYHIAKEAGTNAIMAEACLYIGYNNYLSQPDISLKYYFKCIEHCRFSECRSLAAYGYSAIGNVYESRDEAAEALRYYNMSLQIRKKIGSPVELVSSLIETARAFNRLQDYRKSAALIEEALKIAETNKGNEQNLAYLYEMKGHDIAGHLSDFKTALDYFLRAYNISEQNELSGTNSIKPIAEMYLKLGDHKNAARYFKIYNDLLELKQKSRLREILKTEDVLKQELEREKQVVMNAEREIIIMTQQKEHTYRNIYIAGILVLIGFMFFIFRNSRLHRKLNQNLGNEVKERTHALQKTTNELMRSEKRLMDTNKELESFIYRTSHDLKGPLSSAKGLVNLAMNSNKPDEVWEYLRLTKSSIDKLDGILITLYEVSVIRKGTVVLKECDIVALINNVIMELSHEVNYKKIKFNIDNKLKATFVSDELLTQTILRNILENTVKYSQLGISEPYVNISIGEEGKCNVITVEDNGIGIRPEYLDKIFDPFVRANDTTKGTGLGLYIVTNALDKLGGKIELVRSEPYKGSVFKMYFPK